MSEKFTIVVNNELDKQHYQEKIKKLNAQNGRVRIAFGFEKRDMPDGAILPFVRTENNLYEGKMNVGAFLARL